MKRRLSLSAPGTTDPTQVHEWLSFPDPDEKRTWLVDATFLLSNWTCIYGRGCKGVRTEPTEWMHEGCCAYGAHFVDEDDLARVKKAASSLTAQQWQFRSRARHGKQIARRSTLDGESVWITRQADDSCIFLNRPDFPGGPGCALHRAALENGVSPLKMKPEVCWQLPLRRVDHTEPDGSITSVLGPWERKHWGAGGDHFAWWCTESPEAYQGTQPVYVQLKEEIIELTSASFYRALEKLLQRAARTAE
jgi:hypothetical protein